MIFFWRRRAMSEERAAEKYADSRDTLRRLASGQSREDRAVIDRLIERVDGLVKGDLSRPPAEVERDIQHALNESKEKLKFS